MLTNLYRSFYFLVISALIAFIPAVFIGALVHWIEPEYEAYAIGIVFGALFSELISRRKAKWI